MPREGVRRGEGGGRTYRTGIRDVQKVGTAPWLTEICNQLVIGTGAGGRGAGDTSDVERLARKVQGLLPCLLPRLVRNTGIWWSTASSLVALEVAHFWSGGGG